MSYASRIRAKGPGRVIEEFNWDEQMAATFARARSILINSEFVDVEEDLSNFAAASSEVWRDEEKIKHWARSEIVRQYDGLVRAVFAELARVTDRLDEATEHLDRAERKVTLQEGHISQYQDTITHLRAESAQENAGKQALIKALGALDQSETIALAVLRMHEMQERGTW